MQKVQKTYTLECKREAVRLAQTSGKPITQVARALDSYGLSLLTNREVIAVDQTGHPATPVSQTTNQQVWSAKNVDGSYTVALFNLDSSSATVQAN
jgi:hypothetical protein